MLLETVPRRLRLCGLGGGNALELNCKNVYLGTGGNVLNVLDLGTGQRRLSLLSDLSQIAFLADNLDAIDFYIIPVYPHDVDINAVDTNSYYQALINTGKHVMGGIHHLPAINKVIDLAVRLSGGEDLLKQNPALSLIASITSPRKITADNVFVIKTTGQRGIPVAVAPAPIAGVTSPVTLLGTLVQQNAETLSGVMLSQAFNPGAPVLYGAVPSSADFRTMAFLFGSAEMALMNAAAVQVAHSYDLPLYASAGVSESKLPDAQAALEKTYSVLMTALAGGDYIHLAAGMLESGLTVAYEQYVIDNEIFAMAKRAVKGIAASGGVDKSEKIFTSIKEVSPGGNYMSSPLTAKFMRSEHYSSKLLDRAPYERWLENGSKDMRARCVDKARAILTSYKPIALPDNLKQDFPELL
jgi:trimethylamine--corrinoid protein Co-methyltransferase